MPNEVNGLATRGALADAVQDFLQDLSEPRRSMVLVDIDRSYRDALRRYQWPQLFRWLDSAVTVGVGGAYFFTPKDARAIIRVINILSPYVVPEVALPEFIDETSGWSNITGLPYQFAQAGVSGINQALSTSTAIEVLSDGSDTRTGYIRGALQSEARTVNFTLTGLTPVSLGNWDEVYEFKLASVDTSRTVTVRSTALVTLATVAPRELSSQYNRYRLASIPAVSTTFRVIYKFTPPMVMDESHEFIVPLWDYLFEMAVATGLESRRQWQPAQAHVAQAERILMRIWDETRSARQEQYVPASPYTYMGGQAIYVGALGVGGIY